MAEVAEVTAAVGVSATGDAGSCDCCGLQARANSG